MMAGRSFLKTCCCCLAVLLLLLQYTEGDGCVRVRATQQGLLVASPQTPPNPPLRNCTFYSQSSCCTAAYTDLVTAGTDVVHAGLVNGVLSNLNAACKQTFNELACLYCSPNTATFIEPVNSNSKDTVHLCESFCNRIYDACGDAVVSATSVSVKSTYASGKEFCSSDAWFNNGPFHPLVQSGDPSCFDSGFKACTSNDYVGTYTACIAGYRDYVYTWKPDAKCSGGVTLPAAVRGLRCDIACGSGTYLPGGSTSCAPCAAGSYSIGGGESYGYWPASSPWPSLPDGSLSFSTYCQDARTGQSGVCAGWEKHDAYITSGDNKLSHGINSILELDVVLIEPGTISFTAEVDSEPGFDGLRFELGPNARVEIPITGEPNVYSFNLTRGPHLLRWVYYKDDLWSAGDDMAIISLIEIGGLRYADDQCTACPPGTFQDQQGKAKCKPCSFGNAPAADKTSCQPCGDTKYAFPGDPECRPKPVCTDQDYEVVYSPCAAPSPGRRNQTYVWVQPHFCIDTNHVMPASSLVPCEPCDPGEYRAGNFKCNYCETGYVSPGGDSTQCTQCDAGLAAIKQKTYRTWNPGPLPLGFQTSCDRCSSGGWTTHYNVLDSGDGDGIFTSWLDITDTWYMRGFVNITLSFECPASDCSLTLWLDNDLWFHIFSDGNPAATTTWSVPVTPGQHTVYLDFSRWVPWLTSHDHSGTRVLIHSMVFVGTNEGGAPECTVCPAGYTAPANEPTRCRPCAKGKVVDPDTRRCTNCPVNTMADRVGMSECLPCGPGTSTKGKTGADDCDLNGCTFSYNQGPWPVQFNFSMLSRLDAMWGPVFDPVNQHSYWINICTKDHVNHTCENTDGTPMETFVCQIIGSGASKDLGRVMGYSYQPPTDMGNEKVTITYEHGTPCLLPSQRGMRYIPSSRTNEEYKKMRTLMDDRTDWDRRAAVSVERQANVTLICDPTAGLGFPQAPPAGIEDPDDRCKYEFVWYSLYACHICTAKDIDFYYTPCINGLRTKVYTWKYSPRRCWGGISQLPPDVIESCTASTTVCGDGEYVSPTYGNCTMCPNGNYSIGGGVLTQWWDAALGGWMVYCQNEATGNIETDCKGGWMPSGSSIKARGATVGKTAVLEAERNFLREGSVYFEFSLLTDNGEPLFFLIDDKVVKSWNHTTVTGKDTFFLSPISKGTHVFKWKYAPFVSDGKPRLAQLWTVIFNGTTYTESSCSPCQGRLVQERPGSSSCHLCQNNTIYGNSPYACTKCLEGSFALPGDASCTTMPDCTYSDYYEVYGDCVGGRRSTYWLPYEPALCKDGHPPDSKSRLSCECPLGYHLVGDRCDTCPTGKYWSSGSCVNPEPGTSVIRVKEFLSTAQGTNVLPHTRDLGDFEFVTGCVGECGTDGWRFLGSAMDSGLHNGTAYSWVAFNASFDYGGAISFKVDLSTHHTIGQDVALEFYIDNVSQPLSRTADTTSVQYRVPKGQHRFLWVHYQEPTPAGATILQQSKVQMLRVYGTKDGGNIQLVCDPGFMGDGTGQCTPCTPGYFSGQPKQSQCSPCPPGKFSSDSMATGCISCGYGTFPNKKEAATACSTSCVFDVNATAPEGIPTTIPYRFDLSPFRKMPPISVPSPSTQWPSHYTIQICDKMAANQPTNPCSSSTFVCEENDALHNNFDAGSLMTFVPNSPEDVVPPNQGFSVEYSMGSDANCAGKQRKSILHFSCKLGASPYTMFKLDYAHKEAEAKACEYHFLVETEHACPTCELSRDVRVINGECIDGKREIKYESTIPCLKLPATETVTCSNIEVNEFAILVIAGAMAVIVAALIGLAIYFWNKKRQVDQKYELLVAEQSSSMEMQEVDKDAGEE